MNAGPVADQPVRPRTPPGVGTPLRADRLPGRRHPRPWNVDAVGEDR